jgi:hypothetical protein
MELHAMPVPAQISSGIPTSAITRQAAPAEVRVICAARCAGPAHDDGRFAIIRDEVLCRPPMILWADGPQSRRSERA